MDRELQRRVELLEEEVRCLRQELSQLKGETYPKQNDLTNIKSSVSHVKKTLFDKPTPQQKMHPQLASQPVVEEKELEARPKQQRSLEETITWILPKVFMVILVLGVLWGLKLISDYGYLSDSVKIVLAYALSIGLIVVPYILEKKQKSSQAIIISLYGGAFIIGILTTAAGAILYDVLHLNVALIIAVLYVAYGISISYYKANEILTIFVIFTSLLLPYLLEYMEFSELIIIQFVVILFAAIQFVVVKHRQQIALHMTTAFTHLSALALWGLSENVDMYFAIGLLLIVSIYLYSWWKLYEPESKWRAVHEGLLFSYHVFALITLLWVTADLVFDTILFLLMLVIYSITAFVAYKERLQHVVDVAATVAFLAFIFMLVTFDLSDEVLILLFGFIAFSGIMLGMRLRATVMKVTYSLSFFLMTLITIAAGEVKPFFALNHLSVVMILVYLVAIYMYVKQPKQNLNRFETWVEQANIQHILPIIISAYFMKYVIDLEHGYISNVGQTPFVSLIVLLGLFVISLFVREKWIGKFLVTALLIATSVASLVLLTTGYYANANWHFNFLAKIIYLAVIIALLVDFYSSGIVYKKYGEFLSKKIEVFINTGFVLCILFIMSILSLLDHSGWIDYAVAVTGNTIAIFATASAALMAGAKRGWRNVKILGFTLLGIGIFKLIFFDLSALDLLIRSALFIVVGGVGLLVSNRLLRK
ncbi:MAG: DUF2339 domain-containing protein [Lysinibacillus sp.]